jgi:alpha 1,2-mannosyltransferase
MLSLPQNQASTGRLVLRVGAVFAVLYLILPWLLPSSFIAPLTSGAKTTVFNDGSLDNNLFSSSISPFQKKLPPFGEVLKLQLPSHGATRWGLIHKVFTHFNPGSPLHTGTENADRKQLWSKDWEKCEWPEIVQLNNEEVSKAKNKHDAMMKTLPALSRGFNFPKKSRGIVTTAHGAIMPILMVSLRMLRRTGCTLPVEVFIANFGDYEPKLCEKVLPSLNARCVMLADDFLDIPTPEGKPNLETYQIKPFTILLSSFSEVLFLDADNFPVTDPESLFDSEPFKQTGLVIWPDFWCPSQSQFFYQITGAPQPLISDRPASESGQLLYDKTRHIEDLLLACYYNYYGPGLWYPLLSQGYPGEGDKETYLAAAVVTGAKFYHARQPPGQLPDEGVVDFAIQQVNPADDWDAMKTGKSWGDSQLPHAFIHHHHPKLNALQIMERDDYPWAKGKHARMWGPRHKTVELYGQDLEFEVWKAINYTACDLGNMFKTWEGHNSSCDFVQDHMRRVFRAAVHSEMRSEDAN